MKIWLAVLVGFILLLVPVSVFAASEKDYEEAGEKIMDQMMGSRHEEADKNIQEVMGEDFLKQMTRIIDGMLEKK